MEKSSPSGRIVTEVDAHVGQVVRAIRKTKGISQEQLAKSLGVSFQQIQKYELGHNRVSASKLFAIANVLDVEPGAFFAGLSKNSRSVFPPSMMAFFSEDGAREVAEAYLKLKPSHRRTLAELIQSMAE
ncbi:helix-turn-helix transcriptional regulator [Caulobacter sp. SSI4214]|uniref:helix-turn-helix domain-containing protein n=1 Tax=Caulobacter sp. SSI4214 TaxID=2575739 RepID=UPI0019D5829A|nr:helix-turn-helix transcriptional regulator [Caulobacter sp. SSI4214]